jgi:large repetitive protein
LTDESGYTIYKGRIYFYDDDLKPGLEYAYQVIPFTGTQIPGGASNIYVIKWQQPPKPPVNVSIQEGERGVELSWLKENGIFYNVYRFTDNVYPLEPLNQSLLATGSFVDLTTQYGVRYRYEVRSVRREGAMRWEGEGAAVEILTHDRTPPDAPIGLVAEKKDGGVMISWKENAEKDLLGYNIYRSGPGVREKLNKEPLTQPRFSDVSPGKAHYVSYQATAVDRAGNESAPSRELIFILEE